MKIFSTLSTVKTWCVVLALSACGMMPAGCKDASGNEEQSALNNKSGVPSLLTRKGALANAVEWEKTKARVAELEAKIAADPQDVKPRLQLAMIYMSEARITGNNYYYQATQKILDDVLVIDANNFEAYTFKASVAMSLHQFAEAKAMAEKAKSINPDNAYVYGVLVDANVELGNYMEAISMSDKMQILKPSLESYARASYLREIHGNYPAAIEAMKLAVQAGATGTESAEWARVALGDLYLNTGKLDSAELLYKTSLEVRPDFPTAQIGLAKVEKARKHYDAAIAHTESAIRTVSEVAYISQLAELHELKGDAAKAKEIRVDIIDLLEEGEKEQQKGTGIKHNANRELAQAYLNSNEFDKALVFANNDLKLRPTNIDANELVAWIYYLKGDYNNARIHADKMLATNTQSASILFKAGTIYAHSGNAAKGNSLVQKSKTINPYIDQHILLAAK